MRREIEKAIKDSWKNGREHFVCSRFAVISFIYEFCQM